MPFYVLKYLFCREMIPDLSRSSATVLCQRYPERRDNMVGRGALTTYIKMNLLCKTIT